jgi:hypothetical protein
MSCWKVALSLGLAARNIARLGHDPVGLTRVPETQARLREIAVGDIEYREYDEIYRTDQ